MLVFVFGYIGKFLLISFNTFIIALVLYNYQGNVVISSEDVYEEVMEMDYEIVDVIYNDLNDEEVFVSNEDDVLLELFIPRINLRENVYTIDSSLNDVRYGVEILEDSDLDINLFFLAAHSGSGRVNYFNDLIYLEVGDVVLVIINGNRLSFVVSDMFYIQNDRKDL